MLMKLHKRQNKTTSRALIKENNEKKKASAKHKAHRNYKKITVPTLAADVSFSTNLLMQTESK